LIDPFFSELRKTAEQLTALERWYRILSQALVKYLRGRKLIPPRPMANLRLVLAVEVVPGNQHTSKHCSPRLWELLDGLAVDVRPWLSRWDPRAGTGSAGAPACSDIGPAHVRYGFSLAP
jgi:hypothetical protein